MKLRSDFDHLAQVAFDAAGFVASPAGGVARFMLDRVGGEVARATSIVRFEPGATFSAHSHGGGEEFLVLDGVFSDAYGDFPAGSYVRNPIGSQHTPGSKGGCTILVKLWQMSAEEQVATRLTAAQVAEKTRSRQPLYEDAHECVSLVALDAGQALCLDWPCGGEILALEAGVEVAGGAQARLDAWDWLRLPPGSERLEIRARQAARLWLKQLKGDRSYEAWAQRDT